MRKLLLGVAAALVCAFSASSASAALHTGSATGPIVPANTVITFTNSGAVTYNSTFMGTTITCNNSSFSLTSSDYSATPVALTVTAFSFSNCSSGCGAATMTTNGFPWTGGSLATTTSPNGTYTLKTPGQNVTWNTCQLSCSWGASSGGISAPWTGGNPATITENVSLTNSSCFDTAVWTAKYTTTGPAGNGLFTS